MREAFAALVLTALFGAAPASAQSRDPNEKLPAKVVETCGLYAYKAIVTDVYDGDTVTADVDLGFNTWRREEKLRLFGIDAPEVRGKARPAGLRSRDALWERIMGREVVICTIKDRTGKYGRYLAEIWLGDENLNEWLVGEGLAVPYDGGKRTMSMVHLGGGATVRYERAALE